MSELVFKDYTESIKKAIKIKIKYIYHLSDIHIHLYKRHQEYKEQFEKCYQWLEKECVQSKKIQYHLIVITGDLLHSKSDLSPECIQCCYQFLKRLSEIMPVIIIPGNHDLNMNNKSRLDSITPILADLCQTHQIYYLLDTGIYKFKNICFVHTSIFDYRIITKDEIQELLSKKNITSVNQLTYVGLFHGKINGCLLNNGLQCRGDIDTFRKKTITANDFKHLDMVLLGDIHHRQYIDPKTCKYSELKTTMAYAGSLIQQNMGEELWNHGFIKWNVSKPLDSQFITIKNNYGYLTLKFMDNQCIDWEKLDKEAIPKNLRLRILYDRTDKNKIDSFIEEEIKNKYGITLIELNIQNDATIRMSLTSGKCEDKDDLTSEEIKIDDVDFQNRLMTQIINDEFEDIKPEEIKEICELNHEINKLVKKEQSLKSSAIPHHSSNRYKIIDLKFDNLFSYGENNYIHFHQLNGIVGIIAPNHMGKSAIIDIILYTLFDKFPRKGTIKDIMNNRKNKFKVEMRVDIDNYVYTIKKSGERSQSKGGLCKSKCDFYRKNKLTNTIENLSRDTIKQTRDYISNYFGHFEDIITTNFSIQTDSTGFIDSDNSSRRKELERIMRFDYIEHLLKKANEGYRECKTIVSHLQSTMPPEKIKELQECIENGKEMLKEKTCILEEKEKKYEDLLKKIDELNRKINPSIEKKIDETLKLLDVDENQTLELETITKKQEELKKKHKTLLQALEKQWHKITTLDFFKNHSDNNSLKNIKEFTEKKKLVKKLIVDEREKLDTTKLYRLNQSYHDKLEKNYKLLKNVSTSLTIEEIKGQLEDLEKESMRLGTIKKEFEGIETEIKKLKIKQKTTLKEKEQLLTTCLPESIMNKMVQSSSNEKKEPFKFKCELIRLKNSLVKNGYNDESKKLFNVYMEQLGNMKDKIENEIVMDYMMEDEENKKDLIVINDTLTTIEALLVKYEEKLNTCKETLKAEHGITMKLKELKKELEWLESNKKVNKRIEELKSKYSENEKKIETNESELKKVNEFEREMDGLIELEMERERCENKMYQCENISQELDDLLKEAEKNEAYQLECLEKNKEKNKLQEEIKELSVECQHYRDKTSMTVGQLEKMKQDCKIKIEKERLKDLYEIYRECLRLIPMILINRIKPILERKVNDLLSVVCNFTLMFVFDDCKVDIYLVRPHYKGRNILVNNSSGFERFISSLAIRLALMEISHLPSPNFMVVDEGWSCFDNDNINNLDVILEHLLQRFDFVLTISHLQIIRQHCDIQIGLVKDEQQFSQIQFG